MPSTHKVVINLATGLEDAERVTVAFLVGGAAVEQGKQATMFLTKEAVRLALPGYADAIACDGCPPLAKLVQQYAGGGGSLLVCPICFSARCHSALASAKPTMQWNTFCSLPIRTTRTLSWATWTEKPHRAKFK